MMAVKVGKLGITITILVCMHTDFTVGAPFDDGGKVFIYHGTSIINTTVQQVYTQTLGCCMHDLQSFVHFRWSQLSRLCHRSQS